jgi:hypothetical protein
MKIVINKKYGGFDLSPEGMFEWARLQERKIYASVDKGRADFTNRMKPFVPGDRAFVIYYHTQPLDNERIPEGSHISARDIPRNDKSLVEVVETLGERADGDCARLKIVEIPDDVEWQVEEYDGLEWIAEKHRTWG